MTAEWGALAVKAGVTTVIELVVIGSIHCCIIPIIGRWIQGEGDRRAAVDTGLQMARLGLTDWDSGLCLAFYFSLTLRRIQDVDCESVRGCSCFSHSEQVLLLLFDVIRRWGRHLGCTPNAAPNLQLHTHHATYLPSTPHVTLSVCLYIHIKLFCFNI